MTLIKSRGLERVAIIVFTIFSIFFGLILPNIVNAAVTPLPYLPTTVNDTGANGSYEWIDFDVNGVNNDGGVTELGGPGTGYSIMGEPGCSLSDTWNGVGSCTIAGTRSISAGGGVVPNRFQYSSSFARSNPAGDYVLYIGNNSFPTDDSSFQWLVQFHWDGTAITPILPVTDTRTRIIDFTPEDGETTSTPVTFSIHAYINPADIGTFVGVKFTLHNIDQNVLLFSALSPSDIYFIDGENATTSGDFYYASTTNIGDGNYRINAQLTRSYIFGFFENPFSPIDEDLSHQFVVGQPTFIGNISQNGFSELNSILASTTATTTAAAAKSCNPLSFDTINCFTFLFIPGGSYLQDSINNLRSGVLTRMPWGYLTRFYDILSSTTTVDLPSYTVPFYIGTNSDLSSTTVTVDPGDMISGANTLLTNTRDPFYGKNIRDIFEPIIQLITALAVIFTIVADISGSHRHSSVHVVENNQKKK